MSGGDIPLDEPLPGVGMSPNEIARHVVPFCRKVSRAPSAGASAVTLRSCRLPGLDCMAGRGFLSKMTVLELQWNAVDGVKVLADSLPKSVVIKAPGASVTADQSSNEGLDDFLVHAHRLECLAFEQFQHVPELRMPQVYYTRQFTQKDTGLIIMENLSDGVHFPVGQGATDEQVRALLTCIAALHAECYAREDQSWQEDFVPDEPKNISLWEILASEMLPLLIEQDDRVAPLLAQFPPEAPIKCAAEAVRHIAHLHEICGRCL